MAASTTWGTTVNPPVEIACTQEPPRSDKVDLTLADGTETSIDHGRVVIAAITSCTNTSNPDVMVAAGLLARNARAKGLTRLTAIRRHALRTSFIPVAQSIAFQLPAIFVGTFMIETVFAWQGLGRWTLDAIVQTQSVDIAVAGVAFGGLMFAIGAILADLSVAVVDPRARVS